MVRVLLSAFCVVCLLSTPASASYLTALPDSVGVEHKSGKVFVKHKVEPKETLYAISRKYNVSVAQIVEANPKVENTIAIGQIILIPRNRKAIPANTVATKTAPASARPAAASAPVSTSMVAEGEGGEKIHEVEPKQTLYSISRMYNVSVEDIIRWNKLTSNQVNIGTRLVVGNSRPSGGSDHVLASAEEVTTPKAVEHTTAPVAVAKAEPVAASRTPEPASDDDSESGVKKIYESGMAEMIDPKADTDKYLALHRAAPVGTIMQVKNAMNGQVVYVRVIGKLPETGANDKVVVKISKKAYQKLGAVDSRFRVDLSYVP